MRTTTSILLTACLGLAACASDPMLTGKPQHWRGKPAAQLRAAWGEPTRIITQTANSEYWEYSRSGKFTAPGQDSTSFNLGAFGSGGFTGASGGINTLKYDSRQAQFENIARFLIKDGKVKKWAAMRLVDGQVVWSDH